VNRARYLTITDGCSFLNTQHLNFTSLHLSPLLLKNTSSRGLNSKVQELDWSFRYSN